MTQASFNIHTGGPQRGNYIEIPQICLTKNLISNTFSDVWDNVGPLYLNLSIKERPIQFFDLIYPRWPYVWTGLANDASSTRAEQLADFQHVILYDCLRE